MDRRDRLAFLLLILAQACHSAEEVRFALYDRLAPARWVALAVSDDPARGFLVANVVLVGFGLLCWALPVRRAWPAGRAIAWGWAALESANGVGHLLFVVETGGYFPGAATAPLLLAASAWLVAGLSRAPAPKAG